MSSQAKTRHCAHDALLITLQEAANCPHCCIYLAPSKIISLKEHAFDYRSELPPIELVNHMLSDERPQHDSFHQLCATAGIEGDQHFLSKRKALVDWLFEVGDKLEQRTLTIHHAVRYLDIILHNSPARSRPDLLAVTCLFIASKFDELDDKIPILKTLIKTMSTGTTFLSNTQQTFRELSPTAAYDAVVQCEGSLLKELRWDLLLVTPLHFVQAMLGMGVVFSDDLPSQPS